MNVLRVIGAGGLVLIALLLHNFYITYELNGSDYIFVWRATQAQHEDHLERRARNMVKPDRHYTIKTPSDDAIMDMRRDFLADRSNCTPKHNLASMSMVQRYVYQYWPQNYICKRSWVQPKQEAVAKFEKGTTYEEALADLTAKRLQSYYGMVPSEASAGPKRHTPAAAARSMWLGVLLPCVMLLAAVGLLVSTIAVMRRGKSHDGETVLAKQIAVQPTPALPEAPTQAGPSSLGDHLKLQFGSQLGVSAGSATRTDPLIITESVDYVSIEYAVARFLMQGQEFKKNAQRLHHIDGRQVDELEFLTKDPDSGEWEGVRRFFFDITAGFSRLGK